MRLACQWGLAGLVVLCVNRSATALVITPTFSSSVTTLSNASTVENAVNYVAQQYENLFSNNITVKITVASTSTSDVLGESSFNPAPVFFTYTQIRNALISSATSTADTTAVASLPATDPTGGSNFETSNAQAKALGLASQSGSDGTFTFGTNLIAAG
jgi:type II secretory pathway pseudopilin PulG